MSAAHLALIDEGLGALDEIDEIMRSSGDNALAGRTQLQSSCRYNLITVAEVLKALPRRLRDETPEIPWRQIIGMRDRLAHRPWLVDPVLVLRVCRNDVPILRRHLMTLRERLASTP